MLYGDGLRDDTPALQEMLDARGIVTLDRPGTYLITKTLIIRSNTRFVLSPGAKLLAAPMSRCALIENEHFAGGGRDENIGIVGGIWDGNCDEMGLVAEYESEHRLDDPYSPALFKGKLIRFAHIDRISLTGMTVRNPVSYGVQIADVRGFVVRDFFFDYNWHFGTTDGIHINGPARDGVIENLAGTTNDDLVSLTTYDEPHAEVTLGPIENVVIRNLTAQNGYSGIRLLSGENYPLRGVHIDGLYGTYRHHAVVISNHNARPGKTWFDDLVIENVFACKSDTPLGEGCHLKWEGGAPADAFFYFGRDAVCGNVTMRNIHRHQEKDTPSPLFRFSSSCAIDRLLLDNVHQTTAEGVSAPIWENSGTIRTLIERDSVTAAIEK
ncbi:MAG: hypothetical protein IKM31_03670 [Oscillospiraceae bacterium]|nr:hypothetical protein [Oscillospiraceae bacterium]